MNTAADTIAAICTAPGEGAISVIRISGPESLVIADRVFRCPGPRLSERPAGTLAYGTVVAPGASADNARLDEVVALVFRAPHSYTREDVVELQGHGGNVCARRLLRAVLDAGARDAEAGEFTRRAFLNGRIDLLQAEAVIDVIRAGSERAASAAMEQLSGSLSRSCESLYDALVSIAADLEALMDFPEEDVPGVADIRAGARLDTVRSAVRKLLATWDEGHLLREGALVVISGMPNVGKSSLLNALLGRDRAIVTDVPGTTRDSIEESMVVGGFPIRLVDTAGLRDTQCRVEQHGVRRTLDLMGSADIHIHVIDAHVPLSSETTRTVEGIDKTKLIIVFNKVDLEEQEYITSFPQVTCIRTSVTRGVGVGDVIEALSRLLDRHAHGHNRTVISERHRRLLCIADDAIGSAEAETKEGEAGLITAASWLRTAVDAIGQIVGKTYDTDILDRVFSRFCIGK